MELTINGIGVKISNTTLLGFGIILEAISLVCLISVKLGIALGYPLARHADLWALGPGKVIAAAGGIMIYIAIRRVRQGGSWN